jgi:site-specific DNA-adenine methylase
MTYFGGKFNSRKKISAILKFFRKPGQIYFEPLIGGAWVMQEMDGTRIACDIHTGLINMYRALFQNIMLQMILFAYSNG